MLLPKNYTLPTQNIIVNSLETQKGDSSQLTLFPIYIFRI